MNQERRAFAPVLVSLSVVVSATALFVGLSKLTDAVYELQYAVLSASNDGKPVFDQQRGVYYRSTKRSHRGTSLSIEREAID